MKVKELIAYLEALPPEARVFENCKSELRELHPADMDFSADAAEHPIDWSEYGASDAHGADLAGTPIVIFGAWA